MCVGSWAETAVWCEGPWLCCCVSFSETSCLVILLCGFIGREILVLADWTPALQEKQQGLQLSVIPRGTGAVPGDEGGDTLSPTASWEMRCLTLCAVSPLNFCNLPVWSPGEGSRPEILSCGPWDRYCYNFGIFIHRFSSIWPFDHPASHSSLSPKASWWAKLQGQHPLWGFLPVSWSSLDFF